VHDRPHARLGLDAHAAAKLLRYASTCDNPSPDPRPISLVVKNGSNTLRESRRRCRRGIGNRDADIIAGLGLLGALRRPSVKLSVEM